MKYVTSLGTDISVFSLGTVQLGMDYGIAENSAKPSKEYAFSILNKALEQGVTILDTANNYGDSEKVIGEWLKTVDRAKRPMIVTKIGPFDHSSPEKLKNDIIEQTYKSLEVLGTEKIDVLMVHNFEDYEKNPEVVRKAFAELKEKGIISHSGISAYSRHDYKKIADSGFDSVQIPLNIFDWSQIENGGIKTLEDAGMTVFIRSVFLQGLVFFLPEKIDPRMDFCVPVVQKFRQLCEEFNMTPGVLAMSFVLSVCASASVVLGCQSVEQIEENSGMIENVRQLSHMEMEKIREAFFNIDPRVINPQMWFNRF